MKQATFSQSPRDLLFRSCRRAVISLVESKEEMFGHRLLALVKVNTRFLQSVGGDVSVCLPQDGPALHRRLPFLSALQHNTIISLTEIGHSRESCSCRTVTSLDFGSTNELVPKLTVGRRLSENFPSQNRKGVHVRLSRGLSLSLSLREKAL
jgi:hypothetical protein